MIDREEHYQDEIDFWQESVRHDKTSFKISFAIALGGTGLIGLGVKSFMEGDPVTGLLAVGNGVVMTGSMVKVGLDEIDDYADSTARVSQAQRSLEEIQKPEQQHD